MRCSLLGYNFKPRPNSRPLDTMGSVKTVDFVLKRMPSPKNRFDEGKSRLSGPEVQAAADSIKGFTRFTQSLIFSSSLKKTKEALLAGCSRIKEGTRYKGNIDSHSLFTSYITVLTASYSLSKMQARMLRWIQVYSMILERII